MRYVIIGAGAIGAAMGGLLAEAGREVVLVARGAHLEALQADGLHLSTPDRELQLRLPAVSLDDLAVEQGDVLVLAVKSQQTASVLARLAGAPAPLVSAQNGISNEDEALRYFDDVHGLCVNVPASHLEPGKAEASGAPLRGVLRFGRYPYGLTDLDHTMAADLAAAGFGTETSKDVMAWKRAKLLSNLGNALEVLLPQDDEAAAQQVQEVARAEAKECFAAAGLTLTSDDDYRAALGGYRSVAVGGRERRGGSTWQSVARGQGSVETDFLNGEVVRLGRLYGVATPVNARIQQAMQRFDGTTTTAADLLG
ncbi:2-dehydropantoate 2-reductase N-terminal domain-containing protein [Acidothermaceae bacterium B102]|nr:2-dehydropantoate 2-reductase N-terminal domain-containing protein [Acidothermaceae bacterium B102]